jgi:flagellar protein FlbD
MDRAFNCKTSGRCYSGTVLTSARMVVFAVGELLQVPYMIQLTRLNNQLLVVNSDLIKFLEKSPDTVLTLVTGEKIVVRETSEEVLAKIIAFRRDILSGLTAQSAGVAASASRPSSTLEAGEPR